MKVLEKFHLIWIYQNGTSFTELESGQKLGKIAVGKWIDGLGLFFVSRGYLSWLTTLKSFSTKRSKEQALPLQTRILDRICKWMLCSKFGLWNLGS
jgi:hypothetical protein